MDHLIRGCAVACFTVYCKQHTMETVGGPPSRRTFDPSDRLACLFFLASPSFPISSDPQGVRVPLLVSVPWLMAEGEGRKDSSIVELVDLYPTIANLLIHQGSDIPRPSMDRDSEKAGLLDKEKQGRLHGTYCRVMRVLWH
jgi:hypothetical protein